MANEAGLLLGIKHKIQGDIEWNALRIQDVENRDEIKYIAGVIQGLRTALAYIPGKRGSVDK